MKCQEILYWLHMPQGRLGARSRVFRHIGPAAAGFAAHASRWDAAALPFGNNCNSVAAPKYCRKTTPWSPTAHTSTSGFAIATAGCSTASRGRTGSSRVRANGRNEIGRPIRFGLRLARRRLALPSSIRAPGSPQDREAVYSGTRVGAGAACHATPRRCQTHAAIGPLSPWVKQGQQSTRRRSVGEKPPSTIRARALGTLR